MCLYFLKRVHERFFVHYNEKMSYVLSRRDGDFAVINLSVSNYLHWGIDILCVVPDKYSLRESLSYDATVGKIVEKVGSVTIAHAPEINYIENVSGNRISLVSLESNKNINLVIQIPIEKINEPFIVQLLYLRKKQEIYIDIPNLEKKS